MTPRRAARLSCDCARTSAVAKICSPPGVSYEMTSFLVELADAHGAVARGDGEAAARTLWGDAGVRVIPGEYLAREADGHNPGAGYIRLALVHDVEKTRDALTRITQVL